MALPQAARRLAPLLLAAAVALLAVAPGGLSFSTGITKDNAPPGEFESFGCTACHGEHLKFAAVGNEGVTVTAVNAEGVPLNGPYDAHATYTLTIRLEESNNPSAANHAGFNLRASAGKLAGVEGQSQASGDGSQATHLGAGLTSWSVTWTPPEEGAAAFSLFVNDVDGDSKPSTTDEVHWIQFGYADAKGSVVGAAAEPEHVEFGISLQQYWIGLIGLFGMIAVMVAGFVYLKFVNPHNTDPKDR